jgi:hypothetical protein
MRRAIAGYIPHAAQLDLLFESQLESGIMIRTCDARGATKIMIIEIILDRKTEKCFCEKDLKGREMINGLS